MRWVEASPVTPAPERARLLQTRDPSRQKQTRSEGGKWSARGQKAAGSEGHLPSPSRRRADPASARSPEGAAQGPAIASPGRAGGGAGTRRPDPAPAPAGAPGPRRSGPRGAAPSSRVRSRPAAARGTKGPGRPPRPPQARPYLEQGRQQRQQGPRRSHDPAHGGGEGPSEEPEAAAAAAPAAAERKLRAVATPSLSSHPTPCAPRSPPMESELVTNSGPRSPRDSHQES